MTQILEEHAFVAELAAREIPAVRADRASTADTLHRFDGFRFAVFPRHGGRAPELEQRCDARAARPLHRAHPYGRRARAVSTSPRADDRIVRRRIARLSARARFRPGRSSRSMGERRRPGVDRRAARLRRATRRRDAPPARRLPRRQRACGPTTGRISSTSTTRAAGPQCRTCGCCCRANAPRWKRSSRLLAGYESFRDFDRRELALIEPLRTLRLLHYSAWIARRWNDPAFPRPFRGSTRSAIGRTGSWSCASRSR